MDLIAFVEARLAEDEQVATKAARPHLASQHWNTDPWFDITGDRCDLRAGALGQLTTHGGCLEVLAGEHAARHDPARVLREVAAKRAIVEECASTMAWVQELRREGRPDDAYARHVGSLLGVLKTFAEVWRDHPDYDPSWSPT